jgi:hypothetical protein
MVNARISTDRSRHILIQDIAIQEWNNAGDPSDDLTKPLGWILDTCHACHTLDGSFSVLICFRFFSPDMAFLPSPFCLLSSRSIFVITCLPLCFLKIRGRCRPSSLNRCSPALQWWGRDPIPRRNGEGGGPIPRRNGEGGGRTPRQNGEGGDPIPRRNGEGGDPIPYGDSTLLQPWTVRFCSVPLWQVATTALTYYCWLYSVWDDDRN